MANLCSSRAQELAISAKNIHTDSHRILCNLFGKKLILDTRTLALDPILLAIGAETLELGVVTLSLEAGTLVLGAETLTARL